MSAIGKRVLGTLEKWNSVVFLLAGVLLLTGAVVVGLQLLTGNPDFLKNPFELAPFVGFVIFYVGLLGLYPPLADNRLQLARLSVLLLFVPVAVMLMFVLSVVIGFDIPYIGPVSMGAFVMFGLGIGMFGVGSYQTRIPSRVVGLALLAFAGAWFVFLGAAIVNGFPISQPVNFATIAVMAGSVLAIGYLLRSNPEGADPPAPASSEVR